MLDMIDNDFCYQLVDGIAKSNGCKVFQLRGIRAFRNEAVKGRVHVTGHGRISEHFSAEGCSFLPYNVPNIFEGF